MAVSHIANINAAMHSLQAQLIGFDSLARSAFSTLTAVMGPASEGFISRSKVASTEGIRERVRIDPVFNAMLAAMPDEPACASLTDAIANFTMACVVQHQKDLKSESDRLMQPLGGVSIAKASVSDSCQKIMESVEVVKDSCQKAIMKDEGTAIEAD